MSVMERQRSGEHRSTALGEHYCHFAALTESWWRSPQRGVDRDGGPPGFAAPPTVGSPGPRLVPDRGPVPELGAGADGGGG